MESMGGKLVTTNHRGFPEFLFASIYKNVNSYRLTWTIYNNFTMSLVCELPRPSVSLGNKILVRGFASKRIRKQGRKFNAGFSEGRVKFWSPLVIKAAASTVDVPEVKVDSGEDTSVDLLACPICYKPLIRKGPPGLNLSAISGSGFQCKECKKAYSSRDVYIDLTVTGSSSEYDEYRPITTEMFRSPIVSFVYERGWRQRFATSGFPGPDEEFKMAQKYFEPAAGGLLVDASCGSGLFSRRFAKCGIYSGVVALDFSENMLRQCYEFIKADKDLVKGNLALVRADISRLPFTTGSVDAVHAGAAIHCWPSPSSAVAEICRVLRPGGVFVATTFVLPEIADWDIVRPLRRAVKQAVNTSSGYLTEREIQELIKTCAFVDYSVIRRQGFIMISARKPE